MPRERHPRQAVLHDPVSSAFVASTFKPLALTTPAVLVRELSNRAAELFALRSLPRHEILRPGPGGGGSWLQEHLGEDYLVAWSTVGYAPEAGGFHGLDPQLPGVRGDEAVADSGYSRCATTQPPQPATASLCWPDGLCVPDREQLVCGRGCVCRGLLAQG